MSKVPERVLELADKNSFPIIEIPSIFGWSDITAEFYRLLYGQSDIATISSESPSTPQGINRVTADVYEEFLRGIALGNFSEHAHSVIEKRNSLNMDTHYCIVVISSDKPKTIYNTLCAYIKELPFNRAIKIGGHAYHGENEQESIVLFEYKPKGQLISPSELQ